VNVPDGLVPDEGLGDTLADILKNEPEVLIAWSLVLFANDIDPTRTTVYADLVQPTWSGYSSRSLARDGWLEPVVTAGCAVTTYGTDPQMWTVGEVTAELVYGWALLDPSRGRLRFVQRFDSGDIRPLDVNEQFGLLPRYTFTTAVCGG
jgi:hypothetical protein